MTLSSTQEGTHNNKKILEMDICEGLEKVGEVKIIIDVKYSDKLKGLENLVRNHIKNIK